ALNAFAALMFVTTLRAQTPEPLPPGAKLKSVEVRPERIDLKHPFDYRQVLLTGVLETGERVDVTRLAEFKAPASVVKVSPRGQVRPVGEGAGKLDFTVLGKSDAIPVQVGGQKDKY